MEVDDECCRSSLGWKTLDDLQPQYVYPNDSPISGRGLLHCLCSHLSSNFARSTGSVPASHAPSSFLGSRHSAVQSGSSRGQSLVRSGSIAPHIHRRTGPTSPVRSPSSVSLHRPSLGGA